MSNGISVNASEASVKWIVGGACFLGVCYLFYKLFSDDTGKLQALPEEAHEFSHMHKVSPSSFASIEFNVRVKQKALPSFEAKDFQGSVRAAFTELFEMIREKSGVIADATALIDAAFCGQNPKLKFVDLAPEHVHKMDSGLIDMLKGLAKSIRKLHSHASIEMTEGKALQEINIICYLADYVENNTVLVEDAS